MLTVKKSLSIFCFMLLSTTVFSEPTDLTEGESESLNQFGFGPAFFVIAYDKEVLMDSKDVRVRGDNSISTSGSKYSTAVGLEVHYDFTLASYRCCLKADGTEPSQWKSTSGHTLSPFLGLYDIENGINGIAAGVLYGYWRGDGDNENRKSLNIGLGVTIHKDQLVLANGIIEGQNPPIGLNLEDYTEREDVRGVVLMISASLGF